MRSKKKKKRRIKSMTHDRAQRRWKLCGIKIHVASIIIIIIAFDTDANINKVIDVIITTAGKATRWRFGLHIHTRILDSSHKCQMKSCYTSNVLLRFSCIIQKLILSEQPTESWIRRNIWLGAWCINRINALDSRFGFSIDASIHIHVKSFTSRL